MGNITITLLTSKRTRQTIDALDSVVAAQAGGYVVVEGESDTTTIDVNYPEPYSAQTCYAYMKNARGEYETKILTQAGAKKTFTLPASMTYKGNTYLTFYAEESGVQTVWLPVVVPVAETGVDYMKAATASEDVIRQMLEATQKAAGICERIQQEAEDGKFNGDSVFIRYSQYPDGRDMTQMWSVGQCYIGVYTAAVASNNYKDYDWSLFVGENVFIRYSQYPDGHDMTETWNAGQCYMGVLVAGKASNNYQDYMWQAFVGKSVFVRYSAYADGRSMTETWQRGQKYLGTLVAETASDDYTAYDWSLFVGDAFCSEDGTSGIATVTLADETDQTMTGALTKLSVTIPNTVAHGFYAGLNFKSGETPPDVVFTNGSGLPLKIIMRGALVENYTPQPNKTVQMLTYSDGINLYVYANEV